MHFINLFFNLHGFSRVNRSLLLLDGRNIRPSFNMMFNNGGVEARHFNVGPWKNISKLLKQVLGSIIFVGDMDEPTLIFSMTLDVR